MNLAEQEGIDHSAQLARVPNPTMHKLSTKTRVVSCIFFTPTREMFEFGIYIQYVIQN